jgi:hypothetical protein
MLIDTREPPPREPRPRAPRPAWEPNWRLWAWVALAIGAAVGADAATGPVAYLLVCATLAFACQAICVVLPRTFGLREHRQ